MTSSLHSPTARRLREILTAARRKSGLTQVEVAARMKRPQSFISKYEGGERRLDVVEFLQICRVLRADPKTIIARLQRGGR